MKLIDIKIYRGRNLFSYKPIMKMIVDIEEYKETPTKNIKDFNKKLLNSFPGLRKHTCGLGYEGGFLERLEEGTYLAHVLEHLILEIQTMLGFKVKYGKTRLLEEPSIYYLVYEFENEACALECSNVALYIVNQFIEGGDIQTDEFISYLKQIKIDTELGPSTQAIVNEAIKRDIPVKRIGYESLIRLGYGKYSKMIQATLTDSTSCIAADISSNKQLTKSILNDHNIPVPYGKVVYSENSAVIAAKEIGMPVVLKPFNGNQGKGVQLDLQSEQDVRNAFKEAVKYGSGIIVENHIKGNDYRILVVGNEVKAVSHRLPAMVVGDGEHSIKELVDIINLDPKRGEGHEKSLTKIKLDDIALEILKRGSMDPNYIPKNDEMIALRENGNISTGGVAIDCTDSIHPYNAELAVRAANAIGIDIAGIDMVTDDISKPISTSGGAVIEVNTAPGIRMHLYPSQGVPRNVAKDIIDLLFPEDETTDLPIVSVTGTNGKTTTVRLLNHILSQTGKMVGMTSTSGTFIGDRCISKGDNSGPKSAEILLGNKLIDIAVLETARGGIIRSGLGYNLADIGIVTNVAEDHLGVDGIETVEEMAHVKSLVVESVKKDGYAVLNAEDKMTGSMLEKINANIILFYKNREAIDICDYEKYINVYIDNDYIKIKDGTEIIDVIHVRDIPITMDGMLNCNIDNSLAVVSALYGLNTPIDSIANGLKSFKDNPGRFQIFNVKDYKIILDYAHNYAGYNEIINLCKKFDYENLTGIIGMPGDRPDSAICEVGSMAASVFDKIYIKEDKDLRGRSKGEVANLLYESIISNSFDKDKVLIINNEVEALTHAMDSAKSNDLIVILYEEIEPLVELIRCTVKGHKK